MFGYERDSVMLEPMAELIIPPDMRAAHAAGMKHFKATGEGPVLNNRIEIIGIDQLSGVGDFAAQRVGIAPRHAAIAAQPFFMAPGQT